VILNPYRFAADATPPLPLLWWDFNIENDYTNLGTETGSGWDLTEAIGGVSATSSTIGSTSRTVGDFSSTGYVEYDASGTKTVAWPGSGNNISMCCWVNFDTLGSSGGWIISHRGSTADLLYQMFIWQDNDNADAWVFDNGGLTDIIQAETEVDDALTAGTWYHLASTFDLSTGEGKFYIDGVLKRTVTNANVDNLTTAAAPFVIGVASWSAASSLHYDGKLARVGVFDDVLTAAQINTIYEGEGRPYDEIWT